MLLYHKNKGVALGSLKRYEEALTAYERAIQLVPTNAGYHHYKGANLLHNFKKYEEALVACEQAKKLDFGYTKAYNDMLELISKSKATSQPASTAQTSPSNDRVTVR